MRITMVSIFKVFGSDVWMLNNLTLIDHWEDYLALNQMSDDEEEEEEKEEDLECRCWDQISARRKYTIPKLI